MRKIIIFLLFVLNIWGQDNTEKFLGDVSIKIIANHYKIHLNDTLKVDIVLTATGDDINKLDIFELPIPEVTNLRIVGSGSSNSVSLNKTMKKYSYYLVPTSIGMAYIEPVKAGYTDKSTDKIYHLSTKRLSIEVVEPVNKEETSYTFAIILIFILAIIGIVTLIIIKNKMKRNEIIETKENKKSYKEIALEDIENIKNEKINNKTKVERISNTVLKYLKSELNLPLGMTSRQVVESLKKIKIKDTHLIDIQNFFDRCDLIKFSGAEVDLNQLNEILSIAKEILNFELTKNIVEVTDDFRRD